MEKISLRRGDVADVAAAFETGELQPAAPVDVSKDRVARRGARTQARNQEFFRDKAREAKAHALATQAYQEDRTALELGVMPPAEWAQLAIRAGVNKPSPTTRQMVVDLVAAAQRVHQAASGKPFQAVGA